MYAVQLKYFHRAGVQNFLAPNKVLDLKKNLNISPNLHFIMRSKRTALNFRYKYEMPNDFSKSIRNWKSALSNILH